MFRELFKEFNERYDAMNEQLARILESKEVEVSAQERETLIDYFNLCGEEHLYFIRGYIDPIVWEAQFNGMKFILSVPRVERVWLIEKKTGSYYGLPLQAKQVDTQSFHRENFPPTNRIKPLMPDIIFILKQYLEYP